jgi:hypothetical protein
MGIRCRTLLRTLLATAILHAAAGNFAIGGGVGAYYGVPPGGDPWASCTPPHRCHDPVQLRIELERDRRMHNLRERATRSEPRTYEPADGPWGRQRYTPPATPEANIQPAYRGASQLRPEYEQSAQPSGEPVTESLK